MFHPSRILSIYLIQFLVCIAFFTSFGNFTPNLYVIITLLLVVVSFWKHKFIRFTLIALTVFLLANYLSFLATPKSDKHWVNNYTGKVTEFEYLVTDTPLIENNTQSIIAKPLNPELRGKILVVTGRSPAYEYGEVLKIKGEIKLLSNNSTIKPKKNLSVYSEIYFPESILPGQAKIDWFTKFRKPLVSLRDNIGGQIEKIIAEPEAGLLAGILLGIRTNISDELRDLLAITGTAHIIALSGYNITIIAEIFRRLFRFRSRNLSFFLPVLGIVLFVLATGLSASVIRAAIMGIMLLLSKRLGRKSDAGVSIMLASALMVVFNPYILLYDIGFQLSFVAVFGLIYVAPLFETYTAFLGKNFGPILSVTLSAQLMTLPLLIYYFGKISLIAPISNLLILPFIPALMGYSFVAIIVSYISTWLGQIMSLISWFVLNYFFNTMKYLGSLKYASLSVKFDNPLLLIGIYLIIIELVIIGRKFRYREKNI